MATLFARVAAVGAKQGGKVAAKKVGQAAAKKAGQKVAKSAAKKATRKAGKKATQKTAGKKGTQKGGKRAPQKKAKEPAKRAGKKASKAAGKVTAKRADKTGAKTTHNKLGKKAFGKFKEKLKDKIKSTIEETSTDRFEQHFEDNERGPNHFETETPIEITVRVPADERLSARSPRPVEFDMTSNPELRKSSKHSNAQLIDNVLPTPEIKTQTPDAQELIPLPTRKDSILPVIETVRRQNDDVWQSSTGESEIVDSISNQRIASALNDETTLGEEAAAVVTETLQPVKTPRVSLDQKTTKPPVTRPSASTMQEARKGQRSSFIKRMFSRHSKNKSQPDKSFVQAREAPATAVSDAKEVDVAKDAKAVDHDFNMMLFKIAKNLIVEELTEKKKRSQKSEEDKDWLKAFEMVVKYDNAKDVRASQLKRDVINCCECHIDSDPTRSRHRKVSKDRNLCLATHVPRRIHNPKLFDCSVDNAVDFVHPKYGLPCTDLSESSESSCSAKALDRLQDLIFAFRNVDIRNKRCYRRSCSQACQSRVNKINSVPVPPIVYLPHSYYPAPICTQEPYINCPQQVWGAPIPTDTTVFNVTPISSIIGPPNFWESNHQFQYMGDSGYYCHHPAAYY